MISLISKPANWARVWDTNRMTYTFSSTNAAQPNFQFQFILQLWNIDGTLTSLGIFNLYPFSGGTCEFNPAIIYQSSLSYDYSSSTTGLTECFNSAGNFQLSVYEYYGIPPIRKVDGSQWAGELGTGLNVYNGCQQFIPFDYTPLNAPGNLRWVMGQSGATSGQFLTDATEYRLGNTDLAYLYFLGDNNSRPTQIRYTFYYWGDPNVISPEGPGFFGVGDTITNTASLDQAVTHNLPQYVLDLPVGIVPTPGPNPHPSVVSAITYDTSVSYTSNKTLMYYFPMGPYQLIKRNIITSVLKNTWFYYKIDLLKGSTLLNHTPFIVWNWCKYARYGRWQLSWLNPHGGFDCFTFDRKTEINYALEKKTYKQKLTPNPAYSTYEAGERVFNSNSVQEITLRSNLLTQKEAQLLIQMAQSPKVYVNTIYTYNGVDYPYGVPYIVTSSEIKYEQKINDKEVFTEIKIRPSNDYILQND